MSVASTTTTTRQELFAMGAQPIAEYLKSKKKAHSIPKTTVSIPSTPRVELQAEEPIMAANTTTSKAIAIARANANSLPFYIKTKGKGKGSWVYFDERDSAVKQLYEYATQKGVGEPVFQHSSAGTSHVPLHKVTVFFDDWVEEDGEGASSIKEGKERVCRYLIKQILRNVYELGEAPADHVFGYTTP